MKPHGVAPKKKRPAPQLKASTVRVEEACSSRGMGYRCLQESPAHISLADMERRVVITCGKSQVSAMTAVRFVSANGANQRVGAVAGALDCAAFSGDPHGRTASINPTKKAQDPQPA